MCDFLYAEKGSTLKVKSLLPRRKKSYPFRVDQKVANKTHLN